MTMLGTVWSDPFSNPSPGTLTEAMDDPKRLLFESARDRLNEIPGTQENLLWRGVPWCWALSYSLGEREFAYLIPDPETPRIVVPLPTGLVAGLDPKRVSRSFRETIVMSTHVAGTHWPDWELISPVVLDEALALASMALGADA